MQDRRWGSLRRSAMPVTAAPLDMRTGPEATLGEVWSANRTLARGDRSDAETQRLSAAWGPVLDALDLPDSENPAAFNDDVVRGAPLTRWSSVIKGRSGRGSMATRAQQEVALLALIAERKRTNPDFLKDVPTDLDGYRQWVVAQEQARRGQAREVLDRSSGATAAIVGFAGGTVETMLDPVNIASLPLGGGGRTVAQVALREALIGGVVEGGQQPFVAMNRADIGEELTAGEAAGNVAMGAIGAGVFGGAVKGVELNARPAYERSVARIIEALPEAAQRRVLARYADPATLDDGALPGVAEAAIGRENMTTDELAAVAVTRREAEIDAINPFVPNGAGTRAHRERLGDALAAIVADVPPPRPRSAIEMPARPRVEPGLRDGTAINSGTVSATPAREALKNRIGVVESGGGRHWANPKSSARGKFQFINGTWLSYHKRRFGDQGLSDAAILAKRADVGVQDQLMDDLLADNAAFLSREGEAETAGNLYLTHFAGQGGARALFRADPNASARSVLGADVIAANPFLAKMTARDVIDWAHAKMGGASPPRSGARVRLADAPDEAGYRDTLQAELDRLEGERLAAEAETELPSDPRVRFGEAMDAEAVPVEAAPIVTAAPARADPAPVAARATRSAELRERIDAEDAAGQASARMDELGARIEQIKRDGGSVRVDRIAAALEVDEATAYRALVFVASKPNSRLRLSRNSQRVSRKPIRNAPKDILYSIAEMGGIRDDAGHDLLGSRGLKKLIGGVGDVIYPAGGRGRLSIDDVGEWMEEALIFPYRPTEREVLELLEDAIMRGRKVYPGDQLGEGMDWERAARQREETAWALEEAREYLPDHIPADLVDDDLLLDMYLMVKRDGMDPGEAVARAVDYRARMNAVMIADELGDVDDAILAAAEDDAIAAFFRDADAGARGDGPAFDGFDARGSGADVEAGRTDGASIEELERIWDSPDYVEGLARAFDDPDGVAARDQTDSLEHDVRAELTPATLDLGEAVDPAIAARQRQQAALGAEAPMQARVDQESTIGSPLFDEVDQYGMRLDDEGDVINPADLLAELDDEAAAIKAVRDCL